MALITWGNKYSVGVKALDEQHQLMIGFLNEFHAAMMKGQAQAVAVPILDRMLKLAHNHFSAEEKMMQTANYPGLAQHRAFHQDLARQLGEYLEKAKRGDTSIYLPLLRFMKDWLDNHLMHEDKKYTLSLNEHGIS